VLIGITFQLKRPDRPNGTIIRFFHFGTYLEVGSGTQREKSRSVEAIERLSVDDEPNAILIADNLYTVWLRAKRAEIAEYKMTSRFTERNKCAERIPMTCPSDQTALEESAVNVSAITNEHYPGAIPRSLPDNSWQRHHCRRSIVSVKWPFCVKNRDSICSNFLLGTDSLSVGCLWMCNAYKK